MIHSSTMQANYSKILSSGWKPPHDWLVRLVTKGPQLRPFNLCKLKKLLLCGSPPSIPICMIACDIVEKVSKMVGNSASRPLSRVSVYALKDLK